MIGAEQFALSRRGDERLAGRFVLACSWSLPSLAGPVASASSSDSFRIVEPRLIRLDLRNDFVAPPHSQTSPLVRASLEHRGLVPCGQLLPGNGQ